MNMTTRVWALLLTALLAMSATSRIHAGPLDDFGKMLFSLPAWPITNPSANEIDPAKYIAFWRRMAFMCPKKEGVFRAFPSKKTPSELEADGSIKKRTAKDKKASPYDECNDGDSALFLGLMCAAGVEEGCRGAKDAQAASGRWFRSPLRRDFWDAECPKGQASLGDVYCDKCINGFSADMALGTMLYEVSKNDSAAYRSWLGWLEENAKIPAVCQTNGGCLPTPWPSLCGDDTKLCTKISDTTDKSGPIDVGGAFTLRGCAMLPTYAADLDIMNGVTHAVPGTIVSAYLLHSKALMTGVTAAFSWPVPLPPPVLAALLNKPGYSLHLEATRNLLRMKIMNPSMKLGNIPDFPSPDQFIGGVTGPSDTQIPELIHKSAKTISDRVPWNGFYRLLSEGATDQARQQILDQCPDPDLPAPKRIKGAPAPLDRWIWEATDEVKDDGFADNDRRRSMGWDCVFAGTLFNKMRVRQNLLNELLDKLYRLTDGTAVMSAALTVKAQLDKKAFDAADQVLNEASLRFSKDKAFVDSGFKAATDAEDALMNSLQSSATSLAQQASALASDESTKRAALAGIPNVEVCLIPRTPVSEPSGCTNAHTDAEKALNNAIAAHNAVTANALDVGRDIQKATQELGRLKVQLGEASNRLAQMLADDVISKAKADVSLLKGVNDRSNALAVKGVQGLAQLRALGAVWRNGEERNKTATSPEENAPDTPAGSDTSGSPNGTTPRSGGAKNPTAPRGTKKMPRPRFPKAALVDENVQYSRTYHQRGASWVY